MVLWVTYYYTEKFMQTKRETADTEKILANPIFHKQLLDKFRIYDRNNLGFLQKYMSAIIIFFDFQNKDIKMLSLIHI